MNLLGALNLLQRFLLSMFFILGTSYAQAMLPKSCEQVFSSYTMISKENLHAADEAYHRGLESWQNQNVGENYVSLMSNNQLKQAIIHKRNNHTVIIRSYKSRIGDHSYTARGSIEGNFSPDSKSWVMLGVNRKLSNGSTAKVIEVWNFSHRTSSLITHRLPQDAENAHVKFKKVNDKGLVEISYSVNEYGVFVEYLFVYERYSGKFLYEIPYVAEEFSD